MSERFPAYSGNGKYAFVSYSHKDRVRVYPIISTLHEMGYNIWYDEGIPLMVDYGEELVKRIKGCSVFLLFVSRHSVQSLDVGKEAENAFAANKKVVRINLDDSQIPYGWEYHLPLTRNYISADAEPGEFYTKVCNAITECCDQQTADLPESASVPAYQQKTAPQSSSSINTKSVPKEIQLVSTGKSVRLKDSAGSKKRHPLLAALLCVVLCMGAVFGVTMLQLWQEKTKDMEDSARNQYSFMLYDGEYVVTYRGAGGDVVLPEMYNGVPVTTIGHNAFAGRTDVTSVTIPDCVTHIVDRAFSGCTGLTSITIPDGVTYIGMDAFSGCTGLTSITIPDSVVKIGTNAFSGCTGLTSVTIPDSVAGIYAGAFSGCSSLSSVSLPDSITWISAQTFEYCTSLSSITIPDSVTDIHLNAFRGCNIVVTAPHDASYYGYLPDGGVTWLIG